MAGEVRIAAHAKTNLFLHILAREETGYHSIESLFALLDLHDVLTIGMTDEGVSLSVHGADVGPEKENLAYRAAALVLAELNWPCGVEIDLRKHIPAQAGLGGGSSDAAATLHGVNQLAGNLVPHERLLELAAELGSDVPFFVSQRAFAIGWGHGERLLDVAGPGSAPALILLPGFGVSTKTAYELVAESRRSRYRQSPRILASDDLASWDGVRKLSSNDFEAVLFDREPRLRTAFQTIDATEPMVARLSGSGASIVAVYADEESRDRANGRLADSSTLISTRVRGEGASAPVVR